MSDEIKYESKDPAVLWYWNDWAGGTKTLSRFLKGCYIDLLDAQFNTGNLSLDEIKIVLGSDFGSSWPTLQKKFTVDSNGLYFNKRLTFEKLKRVKFTKSRKENAKGKKHMIEHMEDVNEDENISKFKKPTIEEIRNYCLERNNQVNPEKWLNHYESNGWKVGKNNMKDWKAAVRTWENSEFNKQEVQPTKKPNALLG